MVINAFQAALLGLFACLASMPGLGGTSIGNYTLGRPARRRPCGRHHPGRHHRRHPRRHGHPGGLHRPSSPLAAPSRPTSARPATSASRSPSSPSRPRGSTPAARRPRPSRPRSAPRAAPWAPSCSTAPRRSTWPGRPWAGSGSRRATPTSSTSSTWSCPGSPHIICSFLPTFLLVYFGGDAVNNLLASLPMDGIPMKTLFAVGLAPPLRRYRHPAQAGHHQGHRLPAVLLRLHARRGHGLATSSPPPRSPASSRSSTTRSPRCA